MKRNRKREPLHIGTIARNLLACICAAAIGLGYLWQKNQIQRLGDELKKQEWKLEAAKKREKTIAANLAEHKSPAYLEAKCRQYHLNLAAPREQQVVRLYEPGPEWDTRIVLPSAPVLPQRPGSGPAKRPPTRQVARR